MGTGQIDIGMALRGGVGRGGEGRHDIQLLLQFFLHFFLHWRFFLADKGREKRKGAVGGQGDSSNSCIIWGAQKNVVYTQGEGGPYRIKVVFSSPRKGVAFINKTFAVLLVLQYVDNDKVPPLSSSSLCVIYRLICVVFTAWPCMPHCLIKLQGFSRF